MGGRKDARSDGPGIRAVVYSADGSSKRWLDALAGRAAWVDWALWPEVAHPERVDVAVVWQAPPELFSTLTGLRAVFSLGAGVDHILSQSDLPPGLPVVRLADAGMSEQMLQYVLYGVLRFHRDFDRYEIDQAEVRWAPRPVRRASETRVGILGLGALGGEAARALGRLGFAVAGWSRTARRLDGVRSFAGPEGLGEIARYSDILVALLPLTPDTQGLLDAGVFRQMPRGSALINCARGGLVVENDLLDALDSGQLRGALLDVLGEEPAPEDHPFWNHPRVKLTPHIAASTRLEEACEQFADNLQRLAERLPLRNVVAKDRGY
jgi:glyoxylate/hydroxypyruvate reductase A